MERHGVRLTRSPQDLPRQQSRLRPVQQGSLYRRRRRNERLTTARRRRAALPTDRAPRTTLMLLGRRGGTDGLTASRPSRADPRVARRRCQHRDLSRVLDDHRRPDLVAQSRQHRDLVARCCQPVVRGEPPHASAPAPLRAVQHRSAVSAAPAEPRAQRPSRPDLIAQCCQPVVRSEPARTDRASAPIRCTSISYCRR